MVLEYGICNTMHFTVLELTECYLCELFISLFIFNVCVYLILLYCCFVVV